MTKKVLIAIFVLIALDIILSGYRMEKNHAATVALGEGPS